MTTRRRHSISAHALALMACLSVSTLTFAQTKPNPPPRVCVGDKCVDEPVSTSPTKLKWNPGHYVWYATFRWNDSDKSALFSLLDSIGSDKNIKGVVLRPMWFYFEGAQGDYSKGFKMVDDIIAKMNSLPDKKHLILGVVPASFGSATGGVFPQYVIDNGWVINTPTGEYWPGNVRTQAKLWQPAVMDRLIALNKALGARYNSNALVEAWAPQHAWSIQPQPFGSYSFSWSGAITQYKRLLSEAHKAWPNTIVRAEIDYVGSNAQMVDAINYARSLGGMAVGDLDPEMPLPDVTRSIQSHRIFRGLDGGTDLRGKLPWFGEIQAMGWGTESGYPYVETPAEVWDYFNKTMAATHMIWLHNTWVGGSAQRWSTGIKPYVDSIAGKTTTTCPTAFLSACSTN